MATLSPLKEKMLIVESLPSNWRLLPYRMCRHGAMRHFAIAYGSQHSTALPGTVRQDRCAPVASVHLQQVQV
jgi:hypothetical protein